MPGGRRVHQRRDVVARDLEDADRGLSPPSSQPISVRAHRRMPHRDPPQNDRALLSNVLAFSGELPPRAKRGRQIVRCNAWLDSIIAAPGRR